MNRETFPDETNFYFDGEEVELHAVSSIGNQNGLSDEAIVTLNAQQSAIQEPRPEAASQGHVLGTGGQANNRHSYCEQQGEKPHCANESRARRERNP